MANQQMPNRCPWVDLSKADYISYHDHEWGVPVHDDRVLFEFLTLEAAQAGLSWYTVLRKREHYRLAFDDFDPAQVACYDTQKVATLLGDPGIIRNRQKILAAINNAQRFLQVEDEFGSPLGGLYIAWLFEDAAGVGETADHQAVPGGQHLGIG